jgi:hypothetical protein
MPSFTYRLSGSIEMPEGTTLNPHGSGLVLPDGKEIKLWEQLEICTPGEDDHRNLEYDELEGMGIFYDGEMCDFEQSYGAEDIAAMNEALAPQADAP